MIELLTNPLLINLVAFLFFWVALSRTIVMAIECHKDNYMTAMVIAKNTNITSVTWSIQTWKKIMITSGLWASFGFLILI
tara:strand:- start:1104 stop:1343 length:240 start_codon:yes stop_codon:yes gene_type:complete